MFQLTNMLNATGASTSASAAAKPIATSSSGNLGKSFTTLGSGAARQRLQKRTETYMETPDVAEFAEVQSENTDSETSSRPSTSKRRRF